MFGERKTEYGRKLGKEIPTYKTARYEESKKKAQELIESGKYGLSESDFWILMNETKNGDKMQYTGLIISHNGCLKINDVMGSGDRFCPSSVSVDKDGYKGSLVFSYSNIDQGIYEVGEVSADNCKNAYPYAMAFKRLYDRVVLKISKVAFAGIYGEDEADEFKRSIEAPVEEPKLSPIEKAKEKLSNSKIRLVACAKSMGLDPVEIMKQAGLKDGEAATQEMVDKAIGILKDIADERSKD